MKRFTKLNEPFDCENCGKHVKPTVKDTYRDHCPFCLYSKHVDINPGDRQNPCKGLLEPVDLDKGKKDSLTLIYKCKKCGEIVRNKMALTSEVDPDDYNLALSLMKNKSWPGE